MPLFKKTLLAILSALLLWAGGFALFSVSAINAKPQATDATTDVIVVLTGGQNRVEEGLQLFAHGRATHLFISGVFKDVKKKEITSLWNGDNALPPCCITLGYEATTTAQNAQETYQWLKGHNYNSVRLVTGNYHMARSLMEFRHALPGVDITAHPLKQPDLSWASPRMWKLLFSEYHKSIYRRVQLIFTPRPPALDETV